jgi:hypothetical protein
VKHIKIYNDEGNKRVEGAPKFPNADVFIKDIQSTFSYFEAIIGENMEIQRHGCAGSRRGCRQNNAGMLEMVP